jgi:hypothetical protein
MKKDFKNILNELKSLKAQLTEDYIFNGEDGMGQEMGMEQQQMQAQGQDEVNPALVQPKQSQQMGNGDSEEEIAMHAQEIIQHEPIVGKIRETAIEGLKKYADHPTSDLYAYFKDVFLSSDKLLTGKGK